MADNTISVGADKVHLIIVVNKVDNLSRQLSAIALSWPVLVAH
ncbi:hypothetical protein [Shewanella sp. Scap07]|nr:hypothetical protein [Shewanella sp. Scap07]